MTSLINLELERDLLVEQIMELAESAVRAEIELANGTNDPIAQQEDTERLLAKFEELETAIADKVDAIAATIAAQKGEVDYLKSRRDHFNKMIEVKTKALDKFENYLKAVVAARPSSSIKGKTATIKIVKNGGKQPLWTNENILAKDFPTNLVTVQTSYKVCTETIRQQLAESGAEELVVDGEILAKLQPRGTHLRIG